MVKTSLKEIDFMLLQNICDAAFLAAHLQKKFRVHTDELIVLSAIAKGDKRFQLRDAKKKMLREPKNFTDLHFFMRRLVRRGWVEESTEGEVEHRFWKITPFGAQVVREMNEMLTKIQLQHRIE